LSNVGDAYRYLINVYEEGDNVFLFGFSRGAYTVRALGGVLYMYGLLRPGNDGLIPYIIAMLAKKTRKAAGMTHTFQVADEFKATFCRPCPPHFVGVWDTVSSVGWIWDPLKLPYTGQNPDMATGRHALSIDERRCYFRNNLWGPQLPGQDIKQVWTFTIWPGVDAVRSQTLRLADRSGESQECAWSNPSATACAAGRSRCRA